MSYRRSVLPTLVASLALAPLVALAPHRASADPPGPAPSTSASTNAVVAGSAPRPAVSGSAALALPRFQDEIPPEGKTPVPTNAEWESGLPIRFDRPLPATCSARKVREWVRVHCNHMGARIAFVAGDPEGYAGFLPSVVKGKYEETIIPQAFDIQLPLRRGDRKVVLVDAAVEGYNMPELRPDFLLNAHWIPPAAPRLVIQRRD